MRRRVDLGDCAECALPESRNRLSDVEILHQAEISSSIQPVSVRVWRTGKARPRRADIGRPARRQLSRSYLPLDLPRKGMIGFSQAGTSPSPERWPRWRSNSSPTARKPGLASRFHADIPPNPFGPKHQGIKGSNRFDSLASRRRVDHKMWWPVGCLYPMNRDMAGEEGFEPSIP